MLLFLYGPQTSTQVNAWQNAVKETEGFRQWRKQEPQYKSRKGLCRCWYPSCYLGTPWRFFIPFGASVSNRTNRLCLIRWLLASCIRFAHHVFSRFCQDSAWIDFRWVAWYPASSVFRRDTAHLLNHLVYGTWRSLSKEYNPELFRTESLILLQSGMAQAPYNPLSGYDNNVCSCITAITQYSMHIRLYVLRFSRQAHMVVLQNGHDLATDPRNSAYGHNGWYRLCRCRYGHVYRW